MEVLDSFVEEDDNVDVANNLKCSPIVGQILKKRKLNNEGHKTVYTDSKFILCTLNKRDIFFKNWKLLKRPPETL